LNEYEAIQIAKEIEPLEKLKYYMCYFINLSTVEYDYGIKRQSFESFCNEGNILKHDAGKDWKKGGFASEQWISLNPDSLFHFIYHGFTLIK
jgi:hypothetical protein